MQLGLGSARALACIQSAPSPIGSRSDLMPNPSLLRPLRATSSTYYYVLPMITGGANAGPNWAE
jgi:hypothetical protein